MINHGYHCTNHHGTVLMTLPIGAAVKLTEYLGQSVVTEQDWFSKRAFRLITACLFLA